MFKRAVIAPPGYLTQRNLRSLWCSEDVNDFDSHECVSVVKNNGFVLRGLAYDRVDSPAGGLTHRYSLASLTWCIMAILTHGEPSASS